MVAHTLRGTRTLVVACLAIFASSRSAAATSGSPRIAPDTTPVARAASTAGRTPGPLPPGTYQCQIAAEYRFRPCTVSVGVDGRTQIDMPGGLLHLRGTLRTAGRDLVLEAAPVEAQPFGCSSCADGSIAEHAQVFPRSRCIPLVRQAVQQCRTQRAVARLRYAARQWRGAMEWKVYYNTYDYLPDEMNRVTGFTVDPQRIMITIRR
jgi:hypothetical protein